MKPWVGALTPKVETTREKTDLATYKLTKWIPDSDENASVANVVFATGLREIFFYHIKKNFLVLYKVGVF